MIELELRALPDRELLDCLPCASDPRRLSLARLEVDRRGGEIAVRARLDPVQPIILKPIGYWRDTHEYQNCPEPQWLVQRGLDRKEVKHIANYLEMGHVCRG